MVQTVRYHKNKKKFELLTKDGSVRKFRDGNIGWDKVLVADQIFTDSKKGNVSKDQDLIAVFGTSDVNKCAQIIVKNGDLQVSAAERRADIAEHKGAVMGYIHRTYVNAKNQRYPHSTLEMRLAEAKIRIDPQVSVQKLAEEFVKKMQGKMILKKSVVEKTVIVSHAYAKKSKAIVCKHCNVTKQIKDSTCVTWKVEVPIVSIDAFMDALKTVTGGDYQMLNPGQKAVISEEKEEPVTSSKPWKKGKRNKNKGRGRPLK